MTIKIIKLISTIKLFKLVFFIYFSSYVFNNELSLANQSNVEIDSPTKETNYSKLNSNYFDTKPTTPYILGPGDTLKITSVQFELEQILNISEENVYKDFNYDKEFEYLINGDGRIFVPRLQNIYVAGLSIDELTYLLNQKYNEYFKDPDITIEIVSYRDIEVYVEGEVETPGLYIIPGKFLRDPKEGLIDLDKLDIGKKINSKPVSRIFPKIYDAIKYSGGITSYSDLSNIEVIRKNNITNGGGKIKAKVNFLDFINYGDNSNNIRIYDGDIIRIPKSDIDLKEQLSNAIKTNLNPKLINVFLSGRVEQPGQQLINRSSSLNDAIKRAGGIKVVSGPINFYRYSAEGLIDQRRFRYSRNSKKGSYRNPILRNGDVIIVGKSGFNVTTSLLREITQPFIGINATYDIINKFTD